MSSYVLCIDIGTSSLKGAVISSEGKPVSFGRIFYNNIKTDGAVWQKALKELILSMDSTFFISAIAVSGNGPTVVPLMQDGNIGLPHLWYEGAETLPVASRSLYLPKVKWIQEKKREEYDRTRTFLTADGFFNYLLTGRCTVSVASERFLPFFWTEQDIEQAGLDKSRFPEPVNTGSPVGYVSAQGAASFGLREGTPVFAGGSDFLMAILGTDTMKPGRVCDRAGTSEGINCCCSKGKELAGFRTMPHPAAGCDNVSALLASSGLAFEWYRRSYSLTHLSYGEIMEHISAAMVPEEKSFFYPVRKRGIAGEFPESEYRAFTAGRDSAEAGCGVVKSIGFAVLDLIEQLEEKGFVIDELRCSGGQVRNALWNQMKADMTGRRILVPEIADGELSGCACAAFMGLGLFSSLEEASGQLVKIISEYTPRKDFREAYGEAYRAYAERG